MTYGDNATALRIGLAELLHHHRIQQRLGGPGLHTVPVTTTAAERADLGQQISRYRHAALAWCLQAVSAANPLINLDRTTTRSRGPAEELRYRLTKAVEASTAGLPSLEELTSTEDLAIVESWREVARAAALGEHDFGAGVGYGRLSDAECRVVMKDAAEVTRALVVLDRRYAKVPGWESLKDPTRLGRAAEIGAMFAGYETPDYRVDQRGWRPTPRFVDVPGLPGLVGVLQAQHNLFIGLDRFPNAYSLRVVLDSQRVVSYEAAQNAMSNAPSLAQEWARRTQTYTALVRATRNLGGLVGGGGEAAGQGALAATRIRRLAAPEEAQADQTLLWGQLAQLFTAVDERVAAIISHGADRRLYFQAVSLPRVTDQSNDLVKPVRQRFVPITSAVDGGLLRLVADQLRPRRLPAPAVSPRTGRSREELRAAIDHRPGSPTSPDGPQLGV